MVCAYSPNLLRRLRWEVHLSLGGQGCSELWSRHSPPTWTTEWGPVSNKNIQYANYLYNVYIVLGIISNLDMIYGRIWIVYL